MKEIMYTQGICNDGAAILKDGVMITIEEVLSGLNSAAHARYAPREVELLAQLVKVRDLLLTLPEDALGTGTATDCAPWSIRDEVIYGITTALHYKSMDIGGSE